MDAAFSIYLLFLYQPISFPLPVNSAYTKYKIELKKAGDILTPVSNQTELLNAVESKETHIQAVSDFTVT